MNNNCLKSIIQKISQNERLNFDDGVKLFSSYDLQTLSQLAHKKRLRAHGQFTYFNQNMHLNITNVCEGGCEFCSFARSSDKADGAYTMDIKAALKWIAERYDENLTEIHIVNGLNPNLTLDFFLELIESIHNTYPSLTIKAFSAVEIAFLAKNAKLSTLETISKLNAAGIKAFPGGGAEIFANRVRAHLCSKKIKASKWLSIHKEAHQLGIPSNCTMLFGSIETIEERVDHLLKLRELQDETKGFQAFIPLPYHPDLSRLGGKKPSAFDSLRTIAISRLLLDNIPHIKAYWIALGLDVAQLALQFGADDIDGTVVQERIYHMSASLAPQGVSVQKLKEVIQEVGLQPLERNTTYGEFKQQEAL